MNPINSETPKAATFEASYINPQQRIYKMNTTPATNNCTGPNVAQFKPRQQLEAEKYHRQLAAMGISPTESVSRLMDFFIKQDMEGKAVREVSQHLNYAGNVRVFQ